MNYAVLWDSISQIKTTSKNVDTKLDYTEEWISVTEDKAETIRPDTDKGRQLMDATGRNPEPLETCFVNNLFTADLFSKHWCVPAFCSSARHRRPWSRLQGLSPGREPRPSWNPASFRQLFLTPQWVCSLSWKLLQFNFLLEHCSNDA